MDSLIVQQLTQLVPRCAAYQATPQAAGADLATPPHVSALYLEVAACGAGIGGGQTVPSSPTLLCNYSPPSYWSDCYSTPPVDAKADAEHFACGSPLRHHPSYAHRGEEGREQHGDSSLEELLDDFDYCNAIEEIASLDVPAKEQRAGVDVLLASLRPSGHDAKQLLFINQLGSVITSQPDAMSIKTERPSSPCWTSGQQNAQGLASVLSLVMEQVNEEVRSTCEILGVSPSKSIIRNSIQISQKKRLTS